jgi:glucosamine kinase
VVLDGEGRELGRAEGSGAIADALNPGPPTAAVAQVCRAALEAAGGGVPAHALWAALSGAGREEARAAVEERLLRAGVAGRVRVGTDIGAAFHDAFGDGPGILLVAGTGSIAWGRAEDGREARAGGWGQHLGDEGSAYALGVAALKEATWQADGRAPRTGLGDAVLAHLGFAGAGDLIPWAASATKREVAALAPVVTRGASADPAAVAILARAAADLDAHVAALVARLAPWSRPPAVALTGGLLQPGGPLRAPLEEALAQRGLGLAPREPDPAMGAARLALGVG